MSSLRPNYQRTIREHRIQEPDGRVIQAYSLAETATEKSSRWLIVPAMTAKRAFRGQEATGIGEAIMKKEPRLKALWSMRLANQMATLPPFDQVFREIRRVLRQANLL